MKTELEKRFEKRLAEIEEELKESFEKMKRSLPVIGSRERDDIRDGVLKSAALEQLSGFLRIIEDLKEDERYDDKSSYLHRLKSIQPEYEDDEDDPEQSIFSRYVKNSCSAFIENLKKEHIKLEGELRTSPPKARM